VARGTSTGDGVGLRYHPALDLAKSRMNRMVSSSAWNSRALTRCAASTASALCWVRWQALLIGLSRQQHIRAPKQVIGRSMPWMVVEPRCSASIDVNVLAFFRPFCSPAYGTITPYPVRSAFHRYLFEDPAKRLFGSSSQNAKRLVGPEFNVSRVRIEV